MTIINYNNKHQSKFSFLNTINCSILENERYGNHKRNIFDIILPRSDKPSALVIFFHGGGFKNGDKDDGYRYPKDIVKYLKNNIAFATANYRYFKTNDSLGVKACINDAVTFLQFVKHNHRKYNINKEQIGCFGSSAGAGMSLYIAFHNDLKVNKNTTLKGESTKIKCAGALATQATYNLFRWKEFIPGLMLYTFFNYKKFTNTAARFYGYKSYKQLKPNTKKVLKELDLLEMITPKSPPIYIMNLQKEWFPYNQFITEHHRNHAKTLSKYLTQNNVEHKMYIYSRKFKNSISPNYTICDFMIDKLTE